MSEWRFFTNQHGYVLTVWTLVFYNISSVLIVITQPLWISQTPFGPPFALIQGTLEPLGAPFKKIPTEACPIIRRGSVAWIGSGPEFFISLANHQEWKHAYTVFGSLLPEDMEIAERIAQLPSKPEVWNNINVSVMEKPVSLSVRRIKTSNGDLNTNVGSNWNDIINVRLYNDIVCSFFFFFFPPLLLSYM